MKHLLMLVDTTQKLVHHALNAIQNFPLCSDETFTEHEKNECSLCVFIIQDEILSLIIDNPTMTIKSLTQTVASKIDKSPIPINIEINHL